VDELSPIDSLLVRLGMTSCNHFDFVPGNIAPLLVTPVILGLKKIAMKVGANFCT
jgi:hypothetical protein